MKLSLLIFSGLALSIFRGYAQRLEVQLPPGASVNQGITGQPYRNGIRSAVIRLQKDSVSNTYRYGSGKGAPNRLAAGFYELLLEPYRAMPFVINGQPQLVSKPSLDQLTSYAVAGSDTENMALAYFLGRYANYAARFSQLEEGIKTQGANDPQRALDSFVEGFLYCRNEMQASMDTLNHQYPNTYASQYLASLYATRFAPADSLKATLGQIHGHFFDSWKLGSPVAFNNPFILAELTIYYTYFGSRGGELYSGIGTLLGRSDVKGKQAITGPLIDMVSQVLFAIQHPKAELYTLYMGEIYGESCSVTSTTGTRSTAMPERLKRMQVGARFPPFRFGRWGQPGRVSLATVWTRQPYTLVYFWQSTCPHCTEVAPKVEQFTAENLADMQTIAVSIDPEADKSSLMAYLKTTKREGRASGTRWVDCWEPGGIDSPQLRQIYLPGTPFFVLLNARGEVVSTSGSLEVIRAAKTRSR